MSTDRIPQLKALWQQAFGDTDRFVDRFFAHFFSPDRCRVLEQDGKVVSALYWFDGYLDGRKWAYLYAVATDVAHRGKGFCRTLMEETHRHLEASGYAGAVLVPAEEGLWGYYGAMGYQEFGGMESFFCTAGSETEELERIAWEAYRELRKSYLPEGGIDQHPVFPFYEGWGGFYRGKDFLFAAAVDGDALCTQEFFGRPEVLPGVLNALGVKTGNIRMPGGDAPCGMYRLFSSDAAIPGYLGFALD